MNSAHSYAEGYELDTRPVAMFSQWARDRVINGSHDRSCPYRTLDMYTRIYMLESAVHAIGKIGVSQCPKAREIDCKLPSSNPLRCMIPDFTLVASAKMEAPDILEQMVVRAMLPWSIGRPAHGSWGSEWFRLDVDDAAICWNAIRVLIAHSDKETIQDKATP